MIDSNLEEYLAIFDGRVRERRLGEVEEASQTAPMSPWETAFTEVFLETLEDVGQLPSLEILYFQKKLGRANGKVNAYGVSEVDAHVDLVVTICTDGDEQSAKKIPRSEVASALKSALHVFDAAKDPVHERMEPASAAHDMMEHLHEVREETNTVRVTVIVEGIADRIPEVEQREGFPEVQLDVWDLERIYRADSSDLTYESFKIDLMEYLNSPLQCITSETAPEDHRCYLAMVPGDLLHDLYHKYGSRLLELNVRSFLQARGKVNKGIRDTLLNDPLHFLAYNNGISITVDDLEIVKNPDGGHAIRSVRGLQIVNGGQTVASIYRAKHRDNADLSQVQVPAKITQVGSGHLDYLVPMISRYANTQNKVNETDFSSNHPFHVSIQRLSEQVWVPGETSRWFYERARGQWEVARTRQGTTPSKLRSFDQSVPRQQKVDKILLAKAVNAWNELPHIVSLGGQKNFVRFMDDLIAYGENWTPDEDYYKQLIARIIIFKQGERTARQIGFSAYRAQAVSYTVSLLSYRTAGRVSLSDIWNNQIVSEALSDTLKNWMPNIHEEIVQTAGSRNVTEWCKKKECWSLIQSLRLDFAEGFEEELAEGVPLPNVGRFSERKGSAPRDLTPEERERQALVMRYGPDEWQRFVSCARNDPEMDDFHVKLAGSVLGYAAGGWRQVPSPKQTKYLVEVINRYQNAELAEGNN